MTSPEYPMCISDTVSTRREGQTDLSPYQTNWGHPLWTEQFTFKSVLMSTTWSTQIKNFQHSVQGRYAHREVDTLTQASGPQTSHTTKHSLDYPRQRIQSHWVTIAVTEHYL